MPVSALPAFALEDLSAVTAYVAYPMESADGSNWPNITAGTIPSSGYQSSGDGFCGDYLRTTAAQWTPTLSSAINLDPNGSFGGSKSSWAIGVQFAFRAVSGTFSDQEIFRITYATPFVLGHSCAVRVTGIGDSSSFELQLINGALPNTLAIEPLVATPNANGWWQVGFVVFMDYLRLVVDCTHGWDNIAATSLGEVGVQYGDTRVTAVTSTGQAIYADADDISGGFAGSITSFRLGSPSPGQVADFDSLVIGYHNLDGIDIGGGSLHYISGTQPCDGFIAPGPRSLLSWNPREAEDDIPLCLDCDLGFPPRIRFVDGAACQVSFDADGRQALIDPNGLPVSIGTGVAVRPDKVRLDPTDPNAEAVNGDGTGASVEVTSDPFALPVALGASGPSLPLTPPSPGPDPVPPPAPPDPSSTDGCVTATPSAPATIPASGCDTP